MMNEDSYREYAAECVRQAQNEPTPEDRNMVLNMALAWLRLANLSEALKDETAPGTEPEVEQTSADEQPTLAS